MEKEDVIRMSKHLRKIHNLVKKIIKKRAHNKELSANPGKRLGNSRNRTDGELCTRCSWKRWIGLCRG